MNTVPLIATASAVDRRNFTLENLDAAAVHLVHATDLLVMRDDEAAERSLRKFVAHVRAALETFKEMRAAAAPPDDGGRS